jgi:hypothetical protein
MISFAGRIREVTLYLRTCFPEVRLVMVDMQAGYEVRDEKILKWILGKFVTEMLSAVKDMAHR